MVLTKKKKFKKYFGQSGLLQAKMTRRSLRASCTEKRRELGVRCITAKHEGLLSKVLNIRDELTRRVRPRLLVLLAAK